MHDPHSRFHREILPHLDAAYNLARYLAGPHADDILQDAALRAFKALPTFRGENPKAWLLAITRNCCHTHHQQSRHHTAATRHAPELDHAPLPATDPGPDESLFTQLDIEALHAALADLPPEYREVLLLREFENLDYKEIAAVAHIPIGTVMSRLARAREKLRTALTPTRAQPHPHQKPLEAH